jgi:hypothetical protein
MSVEFHRLPPPELAVDYPHRRADDADPPPVESATFHGVDPAGSDWDYTMRADSYREGDFWILVGGEPQVLTPEDCVYLRAMLGRHLARLDS